MKTPTVSVVIASYNHEKYVAETIESVLNQTFQDFEIIITDDGSSDKTVEIIKQFSDPRINLFVFEKNKGACSALNNSIINSKGKYIACLNSDDSWELNKLEKQVKFLDENPDIGAVFTNAKIIDENGKDFENKNHFYYSIFDQENLNKNEWLRYFFFQGNCLCHPSAMVRKNAHDKAGLYNENLANLYDFDLWIRICLNYEIHVLHEKLTLFRLRDDEANASTGNKPGRRIRTKFEYKQVLDNYLKIEDTDFLLSIFPDARSYGEIEAELIPYFLSRIAYDSDVDFMQLWGLENIYHLMRSPELAIKLEKNCNFKYSDFLKLSYNADTFRMYSHPELEKVTLKKDKINKEKNDLLNQKKELITELEIKEKDLTNLISSIDDINSNIFEMSYFSNHGRSIRQRLVSIFPSTYILLNRNNNSLKRALTNIKGYKSIKENNLFDIGYYLKNYQDVQVSGADPIMHYLYHGASEGRNPSPNFDSNSYLKSNNDVKRSKLNPLVHYALYGIHEARNGLNVQLRTRLSSKKRERLEEKYGVSVIMPTYNREDIIERAIDSVLSQTFTNYELIVIDDGSKDSTEELITTKYTAQINSGKIKYIKQKNGGVSSARNKGLSEARGSIIAYLDSDNYWLDTYLEKMVSSLVDNNKNTAYASMEVSDTVRKKQFIRNAEYDRKKLLNSNFIDLNVFVHKRFLYDQMGGFDESLTRLVDWDLILRYTRLNEPYFVSEVLTKYFLSEKLNNISNTINLGDNYDKVQQKHSPEIIKKEMGDLRIGYVLWDFPAFSQTFVMNELRWLVENNYDVKVFYKEKPDKEAELDFEIESYQIKDEADLVEKINEFKINMMHTHFVYPACTLLTFPAAEKTGVPFTVCAHAVDIFHKKNDKRNKIGEIGRNEYCKRVFIPGKFHYDYLSQRGVPEEKLMFVRQATKYEIDEEINQDLPRFKRDIKNVITIARFVEKKGIDTLIDAAKILEKEDLVFRIYGYGPLENDLQKQVKKLNLNNVVFEGSIHGNDALKKVYEDGDIFALPCRVASTGDMDGMPTVLMEAMAYGIPIVTTNVSVIPDFILNNYSGFIVNPDEPQALAEQIKRVQNMDKNELFSVLKHAQNQVQQISSVKETIQTMLDIWNNNRIDIFLVTYQKGQYKDLKTFEEILDRIFKHTTTEFDLTIVDNDSDEDFKDFIIDYAQSHHNMRLIFLKENVLCGPASNMALELLDNDYAIYICSNEGFILKHEWERKALNYMKNHPEMGMAGNLVSSPNFYNGKTYKSQEWFEKFRNTEYVAGKENKKFKHVQGGVFILKKEAYQQCGGFNPLLPQNHMDVEYSYYMESSGWKLGDIPEWISLTVKTRPKAYAYMDENTTFVHPLKLEDLSEIEYQAQNGCNICNGNIVNNICSSCNSDSSERTIYRIIGKTDKIYRSLGCTLLLNYNSNQKTFGKMFKLTNTNYSTKNINQNLEEIVKDLDKTDVLISNIEFNTDNYQKILKTISERLYPEGLLIIQLSDDELLNKNIKEFLSGLKFNIEKNDFIARKLNHNEFLIAEWNIK